jgi:hypothetical protein
MSRHQPSSRRTSSSATEFGILPSIFRNIDSRSLALGIPAGGRRGCHQPQAHMHALLGRAPPTPYIPTSSSRSKRPGLRSAGSRAFGRLVAPRTMTCLRARRTAEGSEPGPYLVLAATRMPRGSGIATRVNCGDTLSIGRRFGVYAVHQRQECGDDSFFQLVG